MKKIFLAFLTGITVVSCGKPEVGFFSQEGIRVKEDTIEIIRGLFIDDKGVTQVDGSTRPLKFEIVDITNLRTGQRADECFKMYKVNKWIETFDPDVDTTMELVNKKLYEAEALPFDINAYNGQLVFNGGTKYLSGDLYSVDVRASNVKDSKVFEDFAIFKLVSKPFEVFDGLSENFYGYKDGTQTAIIGDSYGTLPDQEKMLAGTHPRRRLTKTAEKDYLELHLILRGADGRAFPGKAVAKRLTGKAKPNDYYNNYHDNSLSLEGGDKVQMTDTSVIFRFPTVPYPNFGREYDSGNNLYLCYYIVDPAYIAPSPKGQELADAKEIAFTSFGVNFRNHFKINETGVWIMEILNPYIILK